jgi:hypothetical protein
MSASRAVLQGLCWSLEQEPSAGVGRLSAQEPLQLAAMQVAVEAFAFQSGAGLVAFSGSFECAIGMA